MTVDYRRGVAEDLKHIRDIARVYIKGEPLPAVGKILAISDDGLMIEGYGTYMWADVEDIESGSFA